MCRVRVIPGLDVRAQSLQKCKYASDVAYSILPEKQLCFPLKGSARRGAFEKRAPVPASDKQDEFRISHRTYLIVPGFDPGSELECTICTGVKHFSGEGYRCASPRSSELSHRMPYS